MKAEEENLSKVRDVHLVLVWMDMIQETMNHPRYQHTMKKGGMEIYKNRTKSQALYFNPSVKEKPFC